MFGSGLTNIASCVLGDFFENQAVSNITSKPKMREKLLKRPPFRFVKDIIYNVSKVGVGLSGVFFWCAFVVF